MPSSDRSGLPSLPWRLSAVWYRHFRVYTRDLVSNGLPPFLEPLIFLAGIGLGLGRYISEMGGMSYLTFLATGLPMTAAMYTAAFECTYSTFVRLEFDHVYDGMMAAPITARDLLVGEILWAGTKGFFFSFAVVTVMALVGVLPLPGSLLSPLIGFFTGVMFAAMSLVVTSFVTSINQFSFYLTGALSPMFFFSGVVFPIEELPGVLRRLAEVFPLTHSVRLARALDFLTVTPALPWDLLFIGAFTAAMGWLAIWRLQRRLVQ
ncbi:MAG: ABC transporter permease [Armatimonadetes bacterium]|nr:ABC transporter permease [Armatimonadota bacterium]